MVWMAQAPQDRRAGPRAPQLGSRTGSRLGHPRTEAARCEPALRCARADDVEAALDCARDAIAAREADAADAALSAADSTLRAHPELPQAAWLMAEVSEHVRRVFAVCRRSTRRPRRAPGSAPRRSTAAASPGSERRRRRLIRSRPPSRSSPRRSERWILARQSRHRPPERHSDDPLGVHALVVARDGVPVWATWLEAPAGSSTVPVTVAGPAPCSSDDLGLGHPTGGGIDAEHVRCGEWVAALPGPRPSSVLVATCEPFRAEPSSSGALPLPPAGPGHRPPSTPQEAGRRGRRGGSSAQVRSSRRAWCWWPPAPCRPPRAKHALCQARHQTTRTVCPLRGTNQASVNSGYIGIRDDKVFTIIHDKKARYLLYPEKGRTVLFELQVVLLCLGFGIDWFVVLPAVFQQICRSSVREGPLTGFVQPCRLFSDPIGRTLGIALPAF